MGRVRDGLCETRAAGSGASRAADVGSAGAAVGVHPRSARAPPTEGMESRERTTTDGTLMTDGRVGAFARGRTDDEEGGEDVSRGSAHGGPGPFAARDPEERLLEGPLAFLHLPRIRPARRRGELREEVEERALIGSRAGVDPRGRERAKALVQLRYGRRRHRGRRRRARLAAPERAHQCAEPRGGCLPDVSEGLMASLDSALESPRLLL